MLLSILYKDWLKIRRFWAIALIFNMAVFGWLFLNLRHMFTIEHAEMIWYQSFQIGTINYACVKYLLIITGVTIGSAQFIPEMTRHRFRLSLHLPVNPDILVLWSVFIGLLALILIGLLDAFLLFTTMRVFFPLEAAKSALFTAIPWFLAGCVAYLGTALAALEPQLLRRIVYLLIAGGFVAFFYQCNYYESYNRVLLKLFFVSLLFIPAIILPVYRYRNRSS